MGPLGPYGPDLPPSPPGRLLRSSQLAGAFFFSSRKPLFGIFGPKNCLKKVEIEGVGPIWRDPRRNSAEFPGGDAQNGFMATQLAVSYTHLTLPTILLV